MTYKYNKLFMPPNVCCKTMKSFYTITCWHYFSVTYAYCLYVILASVFMQWFIVVNNVQQGRACVFRHIVLLIEFTILTCFLWMHNLLQRYICLPVP